jgi:hypothetical protein
LSGILYRKRPHIIFEERVTPSTALGNNFQMQVMPSSAPGNNFQVWLMAPPLSKLISRCGSFLLQCRTFLLDGAANSTAPRKNWGALTNIFCIVVVHKTLDGGIF